MRWISKQSMLKTLTWRITATTDTFLISWLLTGTATIAAGIAGLEVLTKMVLYYIHERLWDNEDNSSR